MAVIAACSIVLLAETDAQERGPLWELMDRVCASKTVSRNELPGLPELRVRRSEYPWQAIKSDRPMRIIRDELDPRRKVYMLIVHCTDDKPITSGDARVIIAHRTKAAENFEYLTSPQGEFISAGYGKRVGDGAEAGLIHSNPKPHVLAQFEAEKTFWLTKFGLPVK